MTADKPTVIHFSLRNVLKISRNMNSVLFVLTFCLGSTLFVYYTKSDLWVSNYAMQVKQSADTSTIRSANTSVNVTNKAIRKFSREQDNFLNVTNVESTNLGEGNDTARTEVKDSCNFPDIDPFDPAVMTLTISHPPITCEGKVLHLVYMDGETIKVNHSKTVLFEKHNKRFKECKYKSIAKAPGSDFQTVVLNTSDPFNDSITLRENDDNLVVECYDSNNTVLSRSYFSLIRVKKDLEKLLEENYKKHIAMHAPKEVLSVLMIGIDGNSKQNFQRHMPKTRNFLLNVLNATELHKYNTVGGQTYPALIPMLTGKNWTELDRSNWTSKDYFDQVNEEFLWSDFRKIGYRTGLLFDDFSITAFHYMKKGWDKPPVDYYYRAAIIDLAYDNLMKRQGTHCVGDIPEVTFYHDYWIKMASTFNNSKTRPYFGFSFLQRLTHDNHDMASAGDDLYLHFLQELKDKNIINNTIIIFFSDHGERFGPVRSTYNGMIESRTPYVFLVFPPWFHRKYADLMKVLKINQARLTSNADLYETLRDFLNFQASTGLGKTNKRGISLFQEIPRERTCEDAGIPIEYCLCNSLSHENISTNMVLVLGAAVHDKISQNYVYHIAHKCEELFLHSVESVMRVDTGQRDENGTTELYQIKITTKPGGAIYEATVKFFNSTKKIEVIDDITRLNMYRGQADCIDDPRLRPFCVCRK